MANRVRLNSTSLLQIGLLVAVLGVFQHHLVREDALSTVKSPDAIAVLGVSAVGFDNVEDYTGEVLDEGEDFETGPYPEPEEEDMSLYTEETYRVRRDGWSPEQVLANERRHVKRNSEKLRKERKLNDEDFLEAAKKVFELIDSDESGVLDEEEIDEWFAFLDKTMSTSHYKLERREIDINEDGVISEKEFLTNGFIVGHAPKEVLKDVFLDADKNKDGVLDTPEMSVFFTVDRDPRLFLTDAEYTLEKFDINQDGKISYAEFHKNNIAADETTKEAMEFFDTNKDGYVTLDELQIGISRQAKRDFLHFMHRFQFEPKDGITRTKWMENYDIALFSPLTQHGSLFDSSIFDLDLLPDKSSDNMEEL